MHRLCERFVDARHSAALDRLRLVEQAVNRRLSRSLGMAVLVEPERALVAQAQQFEQNRPCSSFGRAPRGQTGIAPVVIAMSRFIMA